MVLSAVSAEEIGSEGASLFWPTILALAVLALTQNSNCSTNTSLSRFQR